MRWNAINDPLLLLLCSANCDNQSAQACRSSKRFTQCTHTWSERLQLPRERTKPTTISLNIKKSTTKHSQHFSHKKSLRQTRLYKLLCWCTAIIQSAESKTIHGIWEAICIISYQYPVIMKCKSVLCARAHTHTHTHTARAHTYTHEHARTHAHTSTR